ncbi:precorrin-2 dehydrogenase/sirohydrochlorin ferrochelatase [Clostridiales Family XIII bacterium PM5-7]
MNTMGNKFFPIFMDSEKKNVIVFGGGKIATRRVKTLADFDFTIKVVSPELSEELQRLVSEQRIKYVAERYHERHIPRNHLVLACTNERNVNEQIGEAAKREKIPVSVCDAKEECTFYFPAIAVNDEATVGIVGTGNTHHLTKRIAEKIREIIKGKAY